MEGLSLINFFITIIHMHCVFIDVVFFKIVMRFKNEPLARIGRSNPIPRIDVNKLID